METKNKILCVGWGGGLSAEKLKYEGGSPYYQYRVRRKKYAGPSGP